MGPRTRLMIPCSSTLVKRKMEEHMNGNVVRQAYLNDEYDVFTGEVHVDAIGVLDLGEFVPIL